MKVLRDKGTISTRYVDEAAEEEATARRAAPAPPYGLQAWGNQTSQG